MISGVDKGTTREMVQEFIKYDKEQLEPLEMTMKQYNPSQDNRDAFNYFKGLRDKTVTGFFSAIGKYEDGIKRFLEAYQ